jgi:ketosteroid isomerase-like protein
MEPRQTIESLYAAFGRLDAQGMAACYADGATFHDEVFNLQGRPEVVAMWSMLCDSARAQGADKWRLTVDRVQATGSTGSAHWEAWYRFSATGRDVHNRIDASFGFAPDGRIARHVDRFGFWRWSRQALGAPGLLLGWTPLLRSKVRAQAAANLRRHQARSAA